ncbi:MAG: undecaprenyl-diphosphate phosphatase [Candidatus Brocadiia bacterium]
MDVLNALILGVVQGITEFLPVSSSGHLSLAQLILGLNVDEATVQTFDMLIRLATALGIVVYFLNDFGKLFTKNRRELMWLLIASVPVFLMEAFFSGNIDAAKTKILVIGIGFVGTAIFLVGGEVFAIKKDDDEPVKFFDALLIGLAQAVSLLPGVSRSGATIGSGLICGISRTKAVKFAFMLGVPAILGSVAYKLVNFTPDMVSMSFTAILVGTFSAFGLTFLAIPVTLWLVRKGKLYWFAGYCFLVGLGAIFYALYRSGFFK